MAVQSWAELNGGDATQIIRRVGLFATHTRAKLRSKSNMNADQLWSKAMNRLKRPDTDQQQFEYLPITCTLCNIKIADEGCSLFTARVWELIVLVIAEVDILYFLLLHATGVFSWRECYCTAHMPIYYVRHGDSAWRALFPHTLLQPRHRVTVGAPLLEKNVLPETPTTKTKSLKL